MLLQTLGVFCVRKYKRCLFYYNFNIYLKNGSRSKALIFFLVRVLSFINKTLKSNNHVHCHTLNCLVQLVSSNMWTFYYFSVFIIWAYYNTQLPVLEGPPSQYVQRRPNFFNVGPTLFKWYTNVLCLLDKAMPTWCRTGDVYGIRMAWIWIDSGSKHTAHVTNGKW